MPACNRAVWHFYVNTISSEKEKNIIGYYNIMGQKLTKEPASSIYIIKYDNGKTEKVVK